MFSGTRLRARFCEIGIIQSNPTARCFLHPPAEAQILFITSLREQWNKCSLLTKRIVSLNLATMDRTMFLLTANPFYGSRWRFVPRSFYFSFNSRFQRTEQRPSRIFHELLRFDQQARGTTTRDIKRTLRAGDCFFVRRINLISRKALPVSSLCAGIGLKILFRAHGFAFIHLQSM